MSITLRKCSKTPEIKGYPACFKVIFLGNRKEKISKKGNFEAKTPINTGYPACFMLIFSGSYSSEKHLMQYT